MVQTRNLYKFQEEAVNWAIKNFNSSNKWVIIQAPTGCGKTTIGLMSLSKLISMTNDNASYIVFSLIAKTQAENELENLISAGLIPQDHKNKINFITFKSIESQEVNSAIVCADEAHHIKKEGVWGPTLYSNRKIKFLIGLTGTPRESFEIDGFSQRFCIKRKDIYEIKFPI
ncbi:MAG: hypothetical protein OHK0056_33320 [Bacteriovoracaceae bacterium]